MRLYEDKLDFGFFSDDTQDFRFFDDYVIGETDAIERYDTEKIVEKIREYDKDNLVDEVVYERLDKLLKKHQGTVDIFFLNVYLLRILDQLIHVKIDRDMLEEGEEHYPFKEEETINECNTQIISLFERSDEVSRMISEIIDENAN